MKIGASCLTGVLGFATLATMSLTTLDTGSGPVSAKAVGADEKPKKIISDQIRRQGFPCETAVSAERDQKQSKPDEAVWVLKCENATYRVRLIPDMAAEVERLD